MSEKKSGLGLRVISALVLLPVVLVLCWLGGWAFYGIVTVVAFICGGEFVGITMRGAPALQRWPVVLLAGITPVATALLLQAGTPAAFWLLAAVALGVLFFLFGLFAPGEDLAPVPERIALGLLGVAYVGGLFALAVQVRAASFWWLVLLMAVTWLNDTGAYFAGRAFGKHKLARVVSPKKTWEGFAGGVVASIAGAFVVWGVSPHLPLDPGGPLTIAAWECVVLGLLAGSIGPAGDLCESLLKRAYGVKDSGRLIPGHGGFLDRVDAFLFNAVVVWAWVLFSA